MKKEIYQAICDQNAYDGTYNEKFLSNTIKFGEDGVKEVVRMVIVDNEVIAHVLDENDDTDFIHWDELDEEVQIAIYADFFHCKKFDLDEFFEHVKYYLEDGDKLVVSCEKNEKDGHEYMVYSMYNSCDLLMSKYHTRTHLFRRF